MEENKIGTALLLTAGACWGISGIFVNSLSGMGAAPGFISFCRVTTAFLLLFSLSAVHYRRKLFALDLRTLFFCALTGIFCQGFFNFFYTQAIERIGMSASAVLLYLAPLFTAITAAVFFREKITRRKGAALLVNVTGCTLTVSGGSFSGNTLPIGGILLGIAAAICYSLAAIFGRPALSRTCPLIMTTWVFLFASLTTAVISLPTANLSIVTPAFFMITFSYALLPTALAYILYYKGVSLIKKTGEIPVITSVEAVTATLAGVLLFGENMAILNYLGIGMVLASILLMNPAESYGNDNQILSHRTPS